jgi:hypothetical protein
MADDFGVALIGLRQKMVHVVNKRKNKNNLLSRAAPMGRLGGLFVEMRGSDL